MAPTLRRWIIRLLLVLAIGVPMGLLALYFANPFGVQSRHPRDRLTGHGMFRIPSAAMAPTLQVGQIVFADMRHPEAMEMARGDIVIFHKQGADTVWNKRIVGLPGETIAIAEGQVTIDGRPLAEPYVDPANSATPYSLEMEAVKLGPDEFFLMGDNRDNSDDSRAGGPVARDAMRGKLTDV